MKLHGAVAALTIALLSTTAISVEAAPAFKRIAGFPVELNAPDAHSTSSEIIAASDDGIMLVNSNSLLVASVLSILPTPRHPRPAASLRFALHGRGGSMKLSPKPASG
jgi:hypothetical protein